VAIRLPHYSDFISTKPLSEILMGLLLTWALSVGT